MQDSLILFNSERGNMSSKNEEVTYLEGGKIKIVIKFSQEQAKKILAAQKIVSEEVGRNLTIEQTCKYLIKTFLDERRQLYDEIDKRFADDDGSNDAENFSQYDDWIFEMFQVDNIHPTHVDLKHFFEDEIFSPVIFDAKLHNLLMKGDIFLMKLGFRNGSWHVIYMSHPYT